MSFAEPPVEHWDEEESEGGLPDYLSDPVGAARRRWLPMLLCFGVGLLVTVAAWFTWTPSYVATSTVMVSRQQIPEDFVRSTVREDTLANVNAMVGKVLSVENLSAMIDRLDLFSDDRESVRRVDLVDRVRSNVGTSAQKSTSSNADAMVFELSYHSRDAEEAALVANALAALFVEASISRRNVQAQRTTSFLRRELERDEAELREHSALISEFRRSHRGELPSELVPNLRKLDLLVARIESLTTQMVAKESRIITLSSGGGGLPSENEIQLGELRRELAREIAVHTDEHPNVIALRDRIARLAETPNRSPRLQSGVEQIIAAERRDLAHMREQIQKAEAKIAELNVLVDRAPKVGEELAALEQKETVLREDYLNALRKVEEAELAESLETAQQGGQVAVLDQAHTPSAPVRPRWIIGVAGLAVSLGLAVGVALLLELIDPVMVGARQIEKLSDRPVLGTLPQLG